MKSSHSCAVSIATRSYHQQQNKWYPEECSEFTCTYNNITISYYGQVNSLRLKWNEASKWASKNF